MNPFKILLFILLVFHWDVHFGQANEKNRGYIVNVGDQVEDFNLPMLSGDMTSLADLNGKVVVLQFTASWCSVCRKEMPHLEQDVWLPNKDKDFILIAVDIDEDTSKVAPFIEKMQTTYPVAYDSEKELFDKFAAKGAGVTRNVVIDKKGKIVFLTRLFDPVEFDQMKSKIQDLLK